MSIKLGNLDFSKFHVGDKSIDKIYLGSSVQYYGLVESTHTDGTPTLKIHIDAENINSYSGSGTDIIDLQGNHNATLAGTFNNTTPKNWELDKDAGASVEFINFGDIETFNAITDFTFSIWFEFTSISADHDIITKGTHNTTSPILVWYDASVSGSADVGDGNTATISFFVKDGSGLSHWVSAPSNSIVANQVYNLVVQADNNGFSKIWINGVEKVSNQKITFTGGIENNTDPLKLGAPDTGSHDSDMKIYAFHAYDKFLTDAQITQNWNNLKDRFSL